MQSIAIKHIPFPRTVDVRLEIDFTFERGFGFKEALSYYEPLAIAGNAHAQYRCSVLYAKGDNTVVRNIEKALFYLKRAVNQNYPQALAIMGGFYCSGAHVAQDIAKGLELTFRAANLNDKSALANLGKFLVEGIIMEPDIQKGIYYYGRAAELGLSHASYCLGKIYAVGYPGVPKDLSLAVKYYCNAADDEVYSDPNASFELAKMYYDGVHVEQDHNVALFYVRKAVSAGHAEAQYMLDHKVFQLTTAGAA